MSNIKLTLPDGIAITWDTNRGPLTLNEGSGPIPPIPPTPPGPPVGSPTPYILFGDVLWPASQVRKAITASNPSWILVRIKVPTTLVTPKPNNLGFIRITEYPGTNTWPRDMKVYRNSDSMPLYETYNDGGPGANFCDNNPMNYRNVGGSWNNTPGDQLWVFFRSLCNEGENCSVLFDFAVPERY